MAGAGESSPATHEVSGRSDPAFAVVVFGVVLLAIALAWHLGEVSALGDATGPVAALLVDGGLAVVLVALGWRLSTSGLDAVDRRTVVVWSATGAVIGGGIIGLTIAVRLVEGRTLAEPAFPLLTATTGGAIAGLVAGYQGARARADARRAETANEALRFVNGLVRHDLRNDLVAIAGYADLDDGDGDGDGGGDDRAREMIRAKTDEALDRIETTRAVAETLGGTADHERIDLATVVDDVVADLRQSVTATVAVETPEHAPVVANRGVRSIVDNLTENAVEHNDADDTRVEVVVAVEGDRVRLTVRDNGPGLPPEQRDRLTGATDGSVDGGGLSIVRRLAAAYGGGLQVEDREPRGTAFTVTFERAGD